MNVQENYLRTELYKLIKEDENIFQFVEEGSLDGIWYWDLENPENEWMSPKFWTTLGYDPEEMPHSPAAWQNIIFPEDGEKALATFHAHLANPKVPYNQVVRYRHRDGHTIWIRCRGIAIRNKEGKPVRMLGAHNDLTEVKSAELHIVQNMEELENSRNELASFLEEANDMIQIVDDKGNFTYVNPAWKQVMGYAGDEIQSLNFYDVINPDHRSECQHKFEEIIRTQQSCNIQVHFINRAGEKVVAEGAISVHKDKKGNLLVRGIYRNITEKLAIERQLQRTNELLEQTSELALVGGWETDMISDESHWNSMTRQILEVDDDFVPDDENWLNFYKEGENRERLKQAIELLKTTGKPYDEEVLGVSHKGRELWLRVLGTAEFRGDLCVRLYGTIQDIDKSKRVEIRLKKQREKLMKLSRQVNGVLFQYEIDRKNNHSFPFVSESAESLFELRINDIYQNPDIIFQAIHAEDLPGLYEAIQKSYEELSVFQYDMRITTQTVETKWLSVNSKPERLASGTVIWNGYMEDVSWRKEIEENLTNAKIAAEQANIAKSEFLANMSHEIRTPLNSVIGFSELLTKTNLDENQQQYMQAVHHSGNALLDLINDILDFSKIEAGKLELSYEKTDLWALVQQVGDIMKQKAAEKGIELLIYIEPELPRFAWLDPVRVRQVIINLLGNALKFTEQGEIEVSLKLKEINKDASAVIEFSVKDTGIGIKPEKQQQIFNAFSQEDNSTTRKYGGTGLGLSISNQLLALMGTQLQLESTHGEGSRFFFQIALETEDAESEKWKGLNKIRKVLIIDDHVRNGMFLSEMLDKKGIACDIVENGLNGLAKLEKKKYDVLIVENNLPFMNGRKVIQEVRNTLQLTDTALPIILMHNSETDVDILEDAKSLKINQVISKPVSIPALYDALSSLDKPGDYNAKDEHDSPINLGKINKVLLVDDNEVNLLLAKSMLEKITPNTEVIKAHDGIQAVEIYNKEQPAVILMDIQMPNMNGYDASKKIRQLGASKEDVIIIALTAGTVKGEKERCLAAGMNDYISKPIIFNDLQNILINWCGQSESQKDSEVPIHKNNDKEHFDFEALMAQVDQNESIVQDLLSEFNNQLQELMPLIDEALGKDQYNVLKSIGHKLKGSAGVMHMAVLNQLTEELEQMTTTNIEAKSLKRLFEEIKKEARYLEKILHIQYPGLKRLK